MLLVQTYFGRLIHSPYHFFSCVFASLITFSLSHSTQLSPRNYFALLERLWRFLKRVNLGKPKIPFTRCPTLLLQTLLWCLLRLPQYPALSVHLCSWLSHVAFNMLSLFVCPSLSFSLSLPLSLSPSLSMSLLQRLCRCRLSCPSSRSATAC